MSSAGADNSSAINFYLQAVEQVQFQGETREHTQFQEWKKKDANQLKDPDMQNAVRLHLNYLVISLQRAMGATVDQLTPSLLNYINQVQTDQDAIASQGMMKQSIASSIFVKWYGLGGMITGLKDWEMTPGDVDGIYAMTLLPEMRKNKDPRVLQYWDDKISREAAQASKSNLSFTAQDFEQMRRPKLLWSRAEDELLLGQRNRAISDMFALIKNYGNHPDAGAWISELKGILSPAPAESSATPAGG